MRPPEFTPDAIIAAGQELQAAGRNITGFALRQKVGGGNPTRLKQVWDEFATSLEVTQTEPLAELPVEVAEAVASGTKELTARLDSWARDINDRAVRAADRRVGDVLKSASEQREQAERELVDAAQTVDDMEAELAVEKAAGAELRRRLESALADLQGQAIELATLRERLAHAATDAEQQAAELERLRLALEHAVAERDQARTEAQITQGETRELQRRLQDQEGTLAGLREQHAEAERQALSRGDALDVANATLEESRQELAALRATIAEAEQTAETLRTQVAVLTERAAYVDDLRTIIASLQLPPASETTT